MEFTDISDENQALKKQLSEMQVILTEQSTAIKQLQDDFNTTKKQQNKVMAKQTEILEKLAAKFFEEEKCQINIFPLKNIKEMEDFEKSIDDYEQFELQQYIKNFIGSTNISRCIHRIFASDCLLEVNWDGKFNKIPVKNTQLFKTLLYDAVKNKNYKFSEYVIDVRKGFRYAKNKEYRVKCNKNNSISNDPLQTETLFTF